MAGPVFVVVTAAGQGTRLGAPGPKALVDIAGRPMLLAALDMLRGLEDLAGVAVTANPDRLQIFRDLVAAADISAPWRVVPGGATRQLSVRAGLGALAEISPLAHTDRSVILIHDAARCLTPTDQARRVVAAVRAGCDAVTPALPVIDTIAQAGSATRFGGPRGEIVVEEVAASLDRSRLRAVQTPQGFVGNLIWQAHTDPDADPTVTDDIQMVQRRGGRAGLVPGDPLAFKVTVPDDLERARALAARRAPTPQEMP